MSGGDKRLAGGGSQQASKHRLPGQGLLVGEIEVPGHRVLGMGFSSTRGAQTAESINLDVLRTWDLKHLEIRLGKEQSPASLVRGEAFCGL